VGGSVDGGVHSALELDDGVEDDGEEGWSQAATGSSSHITPTLRASSSMTVSSSRYVSPLSSIHVDLHRVGCRQQLQRGMGTVVHGGVGRERVQCRIWHGEAKLRACCFD
jgi:hypothetical protein